MLQKSFLGVGLGLMCLHHFLLALSAYSILLICDQPALHATTCLQALSLQSLVLWSREPMNSFLLKMLLAGVFNHYRKTYLMRLLVPWHTSLQAAIWWVSRSISMKGSEAQAKRKKKSNTTTKAMKSFSFSVQESGWQ